MNLFAVSKRFWSKVKKTSGCWSWTAYKNPNGYGMFRHTTHGMMKLSHRVAWELKNGKIPDGMNCLHRCDNPPFVRPSHLFLGTQADNYMDMVKKGRANRAVGERLGFAKLTEAEVKEIRKKYIPHKYSTYRLALEYKVGNSAIWKIVSRNTWKHVEEAAS